MTTLDTYSNRKAPVLKPSPRKQLPVPDSAETDGLAGLGGFLTTGEKAYVTPRSRDRHYFRIHQGYAISDQILDYLSRSGISLIFILEQDTKNVLEYHIKDFQNFSFPVGRTDGDPQSCVAEERAKTWTDHADKIL